MLRFFLLSLALSLSSVRRLAAEAPAVTICEIVGSALVRAPGAGGRTPAQTGFQVPDDSAVLTGRHSRVELRQGDEGLWRIGALAVWHRRESGVRLLAGSAYVSVPRGETWTVESFGGEVRLETGAWMLTAVRNEGLKIVCLESSGELSSPRADAAPARLRLRAGQLVFLKPGDRGFSPVLTVFLQEMLATSRLINGFGRPPPQLERLLVVAAAQRESLGGVTNALVAGAPDAGGFEVFVPGSSASAAHDKSAP